MIVVATYLSALRFVGVLVAVYSFVRGLPSFPTRRSSDLAHGDVLQITLALSAGTDPHDHRQVPHLGNAELRRIGPGRDLRGRSEEHTSELQSRGHLVCRLLLEKKKQTKRTNMTAENKAPESTPV